MKIMLQKSEGGRKIENIQKAKRYRGDSSVNIEIIGFPEGRKEFGGKRNIQRSDGVLRRIKKGLQIEKALRMPKRKDKKF